MAFEHIHPFPNLSGPSFMSAPERPDRIVLFVHGYGANGDDLIDIGSYWAPLLGKTLFLSPHAPFAVEFSPLGRQWFSLGDWNPAHYGSKETVEKILNGVNESLPYLNGYIDQALNATGLTESSLILVGFSQGAMMAISAALSRETSCAGVIGYSGGFVSGEPLQIRSTCPVLLVHGADDDVIPFRAMQESAEILKSHHVPVETLTCQNLGHSISQEGLSAGVHFIQNHFKISDGM